MEGPFEDKLMVLDIDSDRLEAGEESVAEEAGFASETFHFMESRWRSF